MSAYENVYGFPPDEKHANYKSGFTLPCPGLSWYWFTYGSPENPNAGKEALFESIRRQSSLDQWPSAPSNSESVGLFQQLPGSWGAA